MFESRSGEYADGFSITFLNTVNYPEGETPIPPAIWYGLWAGLWEEPRFEGSLGIGFDIWYNSEYQIGDPYDNNNHLSVYFNSQKVSDIALPSTYSLWKSGSQDFDHARIVADLSSGKVSIYITPSSGSEFTAVENLSVPGLSPYEARVAFGARTGWAFANHDIDNINVTFHPVPVPSALLLIGSGLAGVFGIRRRIKYSKG